MNVVDVARSWVGYLEHSTCDYLMRYRTNVGKGWCTIFAETISQHYQWRNFQRMPWCTTFIHAVFLMALGKDESEKLLGKPHPGTRVLARKIRKRGRWRDKEYLASPGDLIFCTNSPDGKIGHCGIVERVIGDNIYSIEGNTTDPSGVFEPHQGGAVALRERKRTDPVIVGYGSMEV